MGKRNHCVVIALAGCLPVMMAYREGLHTGLDTHALVKATPVLANASIRGVS